MLEHFQMKGGFNVRVVVSRRDGVKELLAEKTEAWRKVLTAAGGEMRPEYAGEEWEPFGKALKY